MTLVKRSVVIPVMKQTIYFNAIFKNVFYELQYLLIGSFFSFLVFFNETSPMIGCTTNKFAFTLSTFVRLSKTEIECFSFLENQEQFLRAK